MLIAMAAPVPPREVSMRSIHVLAVLGTFLVAAPTAVAQEAAIHTPEEVRPPILERVGVPDGISLVAIGSDGERAAVALAADEQNRQTRVLLFDMAADQPAEVSLTGVVRDLLFEPGGAAVLGLLHKPAKRREGETYLVRIDFQTAKSRRVLRVAPSARALDFWSTRSMLLVAARHEIRTFSMPELRSGPLYRVVGENLAVASVGAGGRILVGQEDALVEVDLDDRPGENSMPLRDSLATPEPVVSLAAAADGSRVLARLAGGAVYRVSRGPLSIEAVGAGSVVAKREREAPPATSPPAPAEPEVTPAAPSEETPAAVGSTPAVTHGDTPVIAAATVAASPEPSPAEPARVIEEPAPVVSETARDAEEADVEVQTAVIEDAALPETETQDVPPPHEVHQLLGRVTGAAADRVRAVVLLGPDNILREAQRVQPASGGWWWADNLQPGRYRVQVDGGSLTVLVTRPPFLVVDVRIDEPVRAGDIDVVEAL
jgi:hypothetical protein